MKLCPLFALIFLWSSTISFGLSSKIEEAEAASRSKAPTAIDGFYPIGLHSDEDEGGKSPRDVSEDSPLLQESVRISCKEKCCWASVGSGITLAAVGLGVGLYFLTVHLL